MLQIFPQSLPLMGAIAGDVIGSPYELKGSRIKSTDFVLFSDKSHFTDDTVLSLAVANWVSHSNSNLTEIMHSLGKEYINVGFGHAFKEWLRSDDPQPYGSWGNGSAMRVSSIGTIAKSLEEAIDLAKNSAMVTHNHLEGIKGAQAVAAAIYMSFHESSKEDVKEFVTNTFGYDLDRTIDSIRENYVFDSSYQGSVPEAIIAFLESTDFESAIRLAVSLGGDADTQASIAGAIAAAFYKSIPSHIIEETEKRLDSELLKLLEEFNYSHIKVGDSLIVRGDTEVDCYMTYTFALAVTDTTKIVLPKGTKLEIWEEDSNNDRFYCSITYGKEKVFELIELQLAKKFPAFDKDDYSNLCNGIQIWIPRIRMSEFHIERYIASTANRQSGKKPQKKPTTLFRLICKWMLNK